MEGSIILAATTVLEHYTDIIDSISRICIAGMNRIRGSAKSIEEGGVIPVNSKAVRATVKTCCG